MGSRYETCQREASQAASAEMTRLLQSYKVGNPLARFRILSEYGGVIWSWVRPGEGERDVLGCRPGDKIRSSWREGVFWGGVLGRTEVCGCL